MLRRIRLGDLGRDVTEADLRAMLLAFGSVKSFVRPTDPATRRQRDFAIVEMADPDASRAVLVLNGRVLREHIMVVNTYVLGGLAPAQLPVAH